jgi:hypothetical protein
MDMKTPGTNYLMLRLALLILPLATLDRAQAANNCNATSPVDNTIITCTGTTSDTNGTIGYGTFTDTGNTYNILSDASVTGFLLGLGFFQGTVNNSGTISGFAAGIGADDTATVTNASTGVISGGIVAATTATVDNAGSIFAGNGILADTANVTNRSTGSISGDVDGIQATAAATVYNAGTISGSVDSGIFGNSANVVNTSTGAISGGFNGIEASTTAIVDNAGSISGTSSFGIFTINAANVINRSTGTISGGVDGIRANSANIINAGTISGRIGIDTGFTSPNDAASTITNSGTIIGTLGTAIHLSIAADTLTLLPGSRIVGVVDMGDVAIAGNDTVNVVTVAPSSKVSSLTTAAELPTLINFHGRLNTTFSANGFNGRWCRPATNSPRSTPPCWRRPTAP